MARFLNINWHDSRLNHRNTIHGIEETWSGSTRVNPAATDALVSVTDTRASTAAGLTLSFTYETPEHLWPQILSAGVSIHHNLWQANMLHLTRISWSCITIRPCTLKHDTTNFRHPPPKNPIWFNHAFSVIILENHVWYWEICVYVIKLL